MNKHTILHFFNRKSYQNDRTLWLHLVTGILCIVCLFIVICASLHSLLSDRSLWFDEAALAYSLITRSVGDLVSEVYDYQQSAPILYSYMVKLITLIFGTSETALRSFSFISYLGALVCMYVLSSRILKIRYSLLPTTMFAIMPIMVLYAAELKPYMTECLVVLLTLIVYYCYNELKLNKYWAMVAYVIFIWFSNPACFFIGAILSFEFVEGVRLKRYDRLKFSLIAGIAVVISFVSYFFFWLKPVSESTYMIDFWSAYKYPLIPTSIEDLIQLEYLTQFMMQQFGRFYFFIFVLIIISIVYTFIYNRNRYLLVILGGLLIALFASYIGKFPFMNRLFLFMYPLLILVLFSAINKLCFNKIKYSLLAIVVSFFMMFSINNLKYNFAYDSTYVNHLESNKAIDFIAENIAENEKLYVYYYCGPSFLYKNNFDSTSIGTYKNNVILAPDFKDTQDIVAKELDIIDAAAPCYILASYPFTGEEQEMLFYGLEEKGYLTHVYDKYRTNIYYYRAFDRDSISFAKRQVVFPQ